MGCDVRIHRTPAARLGDRRAKRSATSASAVGGGVLPLRLVMPMCCFSQLIRLFLCHCYGCRFWSSLPSSSTSWLVLVLFMLLLILLQECQGCTGRRNQPHNHCGCLHGLRCGCHMTVSSPSSLGHFNASLLSPQRSFYSFCKPHIIRFNS